MKALFSISQNFTPVAEAGHAARGDYSWRHQLQLFTAPLRYILSVQHETPAKNKGEMCVLRSVFVWMASRMHRLLTMELQIFQSFHDSKLSAQEKTEIILKSGSWTSFHLNAEVFEYKFSHIKILL